MARNSGMFFVINRTIYTKKRTTIGNLLANCASKYINDFFKVLTNDQNKIGLFTIFRCVF